jgi:hypothetical protein
MARRSAPFDVTQVGLNRLSYGALEHAYHGAHNLVIPRNMAERMHPGEIVAKLIGAGALKRGNRHLGLPREFLTLVGLLDGQAYRLMPGLNDCFSSGKYTTEKGAQRKRLADLDEGARVSFVGSFFTHYTPSTKEDKTNPMAYPDPNEDGRSKAVYIREIQRYLEARSGE